MNSYKIKGRLSYLRKLEHERQRKCQQKAQANAETYAGISIKTDSETSAGTDTKSKATNFNIAYNDSVALVTNELSPEELAEEIETSSNIEVGLLHYQYTAGQTCLLCPD